MTHPLTTDLRFKRYVRVGAIDARPYEQGEEREPGWRRRIALSPEDARRKSLDGGMIARNPDNANDQWYIAPEYFAKNYAETGRVIERPKLEIVDG
jgi:hypothetical protein